jgi:hypothetical protein
MSDLYIPATVQKSGFVFELYFLQSLHFCHLELVGTVEVPVPEESK